MEIVLTATNGLARRQQVVVFDVENARRAVGALDEGSELAEVVRVVAQDRIQQSAERSSDPRCGLTIVAAELRR